MYSSYHGDLSWNFSDKNVYYEHTRRRRTQKYLKESCYNYIECTAATFLTAFLWRRPLNSIALVTTTHRKSKRVSDRTDTQVRVQMTNKWRIKMVQKELYNVRNSPWERGGGGGIEKEHCSNQNCTCTLFSWFIWTLASLDKKFIHIIISYLCMIVTRFHTSRCPIY